MSVERILKDIRFWIVIFFLLRLIGITNPPLEVGHNWRQTTVTMVARNFVEVDNNILYPRIDIAGEKTGITGMEFPLLNYLIYGLSKLFGYQHWYGRLINLLISSFGLWFFFKLVRKYFTEEVAFNATIILAVSIWFTPCPKLVPIKKCQNPYCSTRYGIEVRWLCGLRVRAGDVNREERLENLRGVWVGLCVLRHHHL